MARSLDLDQAVNLIPGRLLRVRSVADPRTRLQIRTQRGGGRCAGLARLDMPRGSTATATAMLNLSQAVQLEDAGTQRVVPAYNPWRVTAILALTLHHPAQHPIQM